MKNCTGNAFHNNAVHCKACACVSFANCIDALSVYVWFKVHVFIFRMTCCQELLSVSCLQNQIPQYIYHYKHLTSTPWCIGYCCLL